MVSVSCGRRWWRVEGCGIQGRGGSLGHDSGEPFGASGRAVANGVVEGEMMGFGILLELDTGRKGAKVEDDFATTGYEGRLLWDDTGELLDQRLLGTPVLRGNGLSRGLISVDGMKHTKLARSSIVRDRVPSFFSKVKREQ